MALCWRAAVEPLGHIHHLHGRPFLSAFQSPVCNKAHIRKVNSYTQLSNDLEEKGYKVFLVPFEVLSSGHITNTCKISIQNTLQQFHIRVRNSLFVDLAKIALLCTMSVFYAYHEKEWVSPRGQQ